MSIFRAFVLVGSLTSARLAGAAIGLGIQIVLTQTLTPGGVGMVMLGMSIAAFSSLLITGGYPALGATVLARYHTLARSSLVRGFLAAARADAAIILVLCGSAMAALLLVVPHDPGLTMALVFGGVAAVPHAAMRINNVVANSMRRFSLSYIPDFVVRPALVLAAIAALATMPGTYEGWQVLAAFAVITWVVALVQAIVLGADSAFSNLRARPVRAMRTKLRPRALALAVVALFAGAFGEIVTLLSGLLLPLAEVAVVGISIKIAALIGYLPQALQHFALRDVTSAMARRDGDETRQVLLRVNITCIAVIGASLAGIAVLGDFVLAQFGDVYRGGYWVLLLFLLGQLVRAGSGMNMHLLSLRGKQKTMALFCAVSAAVLVTVATLAVARWGIAGIGVAVLAADLFWAASLAVLARRLPGTAADIFAVMRPLAAQPHTLKTIGAGR